MPKNLSQAFALVVTMGGYLNRKNDHRSGDAMMYNGHYVISFFACLCSLSRDLADDSGLKNILELEATYD